MKIQKNWNWGEYPRRLYRIFVVNVGFVWRINISHSRSKMLADILCENCPNTEFFLVRILPKAPEKTLHLDTFHAMIYFLLCFLDLNFHLRKCFSKRYYLRKYFSISKIENRTIFSFYWKCAVKICHTLKWGCFYIKVH